MMLSISNNKQSNQLYFNGGGGGGVSQECDSHGELDNNFEKLRSNYPPMGKYGIWTSMWCPKSLGRAIKFVI